MCNACRWMPRACCARDYLEHSLGWKKWRLRALRRGHSIGVECSKLHRLYCKVMTYQAYAHAHTHSSYTSYCTNVYNSFTVFVKSELFKIFHSYSAEVILYINKPMYNATFVPNGPTSAGGEIILHTPQHSVWPVTLPPTPCTLPPTHYPPTHYPLHTTPCTLPLHITPCSVPAIDVQPPTGSHPHFCICKQYQLEKIYYK